MQPTTSLVARVHDQLDDLVATATRAPSPLNTQPWRFRWRDDGIDLLADRDRALHVTDPDDRQLTIACGAALLNLRLALQQLGVAPLVVSLPDPAHPELLARVTVAGVHVPDPADTALVNAIPHRHTHRGPFEPGGLHRDSLVVLQEAARLEGATLHLVEHPGVRASLATVLAHADGAQRDDPRYAREIESWTPPPDVHRRDGVPATAYPAGPTRRRRSRPATTRWVATRAAGRVRPAPSPRSR